MTSSWVWGQAVRDSQLVGEGWQADRHSQLCPSILCLCDTLTSQANSQLPNPVPNSHTSPSVGLQHSPVLYPSHLKYSGVTLSPTSLSLPFLPLATSHFLLLLCWPFLFWPFLPACHFPHLLVLCWLFLPLLFLALAASTAGRPSFCFFPPRVLSTSRSSKVVLHLKAQFTLICTVIILP